MLNRYRVPPGRVLIIPAAGFSLADVGCVPPGIRADDEVLLMHNNERAVEARLGRFLDERLVPALYRVRLPMAVAAWEVHGEPAPVGEALSATYAPVAPGAAWGRPWGTTWFHVTGEVPVDWQLEGGRLEMMVDLGFTGATPGFQAEALAYDTSGSIIKAVEPRNAHVPLPQACGVPAELYLEAASNPDIERAGNFTPTPLGLWETAGDTPIYTLGRIEIGVLDLAVWALVQDVRTLRGLLTVLPEHSTRRATVIRALERMLDALDPDDVAGTADAGRAHIAAALASPAEASAHRVTATGHAHIDSAWLWPVRETIRKCARTFSNVLDLIDEDPDFVFACSSAQQFAWVKESYPALFERIKEQVARGRFVPVGGMWVESDVNMPGGEALVRQFVAGKRFFMEEFGVEPLEVWLPDSFGFSAGLPQIAVGAGARWLLTQKMSWNDTNRMPHSTFWWEGIDGSRIFTHFPPVETYNSDLSPRDLDRAARNFADKGSATISLVPFGYGNGGGGPTREMVAAGRRAADLEGLPAVRFAAPRDFFEAAELEYPGAPVWSGEMYLEFHRGIFTSQARTKAGNRRGEHLLREAELWAATAAVRLAEPYPYDELEAHWHTLLLQQFHDILPGSSIAWVHREAERNYAAMAGALDRLVTHSLATLSGHGATPMVANAAPVPVDTVPALAVVPADPPSSATTVSREGRALVLDNGHVRLQLDASGSFISIVHAASGREVVPAGRPGNLLQLHRDTPTAWDAWDMDREYRQVVTELRDGEVELVEGPSGPQVKVTRSFGKSTLVEWISLVRGRAAVEMRFDIDWHERQKLLKLAFPTTVHADRFAAETQFGHVYRPTHQNTSWDAARFEVCAHRWVHVGEPGFGVAVANDATYGHDVTRGLDDHAETVTTIRLSLLRAPTYPDPDADQGHHAFTVSLVVGAGLEDAIAEGYRLNLPLRRFQGGGGVEPLLRVDDTSVVVEAVKLSEDRCGDVVVRLYESTGARRSATITPAFGFTSVSRTDLLERDLVGAPSPLVDDGRIAVTLRPFQVATLRFRGVRATHGTASHAHAHNPGGDHD
jgi:alpha-mannosidase